jgi:hypothetical protein
MRSLVAVFLIIITVGCNSHEEALKADATRAKNFVRQVIYVKDERTNTCFAVENSGIATVDCNKVPPELLHTPKIEGVGK